MGKGEGAVDKNMRKELSLEIDGHAYPQDKLKKAALHVIAQNLEAGKAIGLRATPTILVGNRLFSGGVSFERIQRAVEEQSDGQ